MFCNYRKHSEDNSSSTIRPLKANIPQILFSSQHLKYYLLIICKMIILFTGKELTVLSLRLEQMVLKLFASSESSFQWIFLLVQEVNEEGKILSDYMEKHLFIRRNKSKLKFKQLDFNSPMRQRLTMLSSKHLHKVMDIMVGRGKLLRLVKEI